MRAFRRLLICISVLTGQLLLTTQTRGQGWDYLFPPRITNEDLKEYVAVLALSPAQHQAIEPAYQRYQQADSEIRRGDVAQFHADREALRMRPEKRLDVAVQRKFHRRCLALRARLAALDDQFFAQLEPQLAEDQQPALQHVRLLRERDRYRWTMLRLSSVRPEPMIDLSRLGRVIEMTPEDRQALGPVLEGYEVSLTAAMRRYASALIERMIVFGTLEDDQDAKHFKLIEHGIKILELNRRWLRMITGVLSPQAAAELRRVYRREAYHGIEPDLRSAHRLFDATLKLSHLTDDQRESLAAQRDAYVAEHTSLTERALKIVDDLRRKSLFWRSMNRTDIDPPDRMSTVHELLARRQELNAEAAELLTPYLGKQGLRAVRRDLYEKYGGKEEVRFPRPTPRFLAIEIGNMTMRGSTGGGSPIFVHGRVANYPPISWRSLARLADQLDLAQPQRETMKRLHEHYVGELTKQRDAIPAHIINSETDLWAASGDVTFHPPTPEEVEARHDAQQQLLDQFQRGDKRFLDELAGTLLTPDQMPQLAAFRRARLRYLYVRGTRSRLFVHNNLLGGWSELYAVDLLTLLDDIKPSEESTEQFAALCSAYDNETAALAQRRFNLALQCKLLGNLLLVESFHDGEEYYEFSLLGDHERARQFEDACRRLQEAQERYYELNVSTYQQLSRLLDPDSVALLVDRFRRAVYPRLFPDEHAAHDELDAVLRKRGLSADQLGAILELQSEYEQQHRALADRIVAAHRHPKDTTYYRFEDGRIMYNPFNEEAEQRQELDVLKFERKELTASVRRRLALILEPEDRRDQ